MSAKGQSLFSRVLDSSFLPAAICTGGFYTFVHQPWMKDSILLRYTTEHAVEYVVVALFIWGIVDIVFKVLGFPREMLALRHDWLPARRGREPLVRAAELLRSIRALPNWLQESRIGKRLAQALEYVQDQGSADEYREHLHYLAEQDEEAMQSSYTLVRFIIGVTPVLGFLGTVVHFGTALSGISFEEMATKLPHVVSEMGQAFNTTTVALAASMTMMFSLFVFERMESRMVNTIDRLVERELLHRFEVQDPSVTPFLAVVKTANDEALGEIRETLHKQIELWSEGLATLFNHFDSRQEHETTSSHESVKELLTALEQRHEAYDADREERLKQLLALIESRQDKFMAHIQSTFERAASLRDDFGELLETLHSIARGEGRLNELQTVLAENLRVLRETQALDSAMQGLATETTQRPYVGGSRVQPRRNSAA